MVEKRTIPLVIDAPTLNKLDKIVKDHPPKERGLVYKRVDAIYEAITEWIAKQS